MILLLKKGVVAFALIVCCLTGVNAQTYHADDKPIHFGFSLGINTMDFGVGLSNSVIDGTVYTADVSVLKPGFSVGIVSDLLISRYLNLRFTPTLHFADRQLNYKPTLTPVVVPSIPLSIPLYLKLSAERYQNIRPYLLGGGGVYVDLGRDNEHEVLLRPFDYFIEVGVGCDIYFGFFKLAPELKFALGFNNMLTPLAERDAASLNPTKQVYTSALSGLTSRMLTLTFNFE